MTIKEFDYIGTYSGKKLHFNNPHEDEVCLEDIYQALPNVCRYSGQVKKFYSVAEHCIIMADYVMEKYDDARLALDVLFHDASESYLVDVPRPVKYCLGGYLGIENKVTVVINKKLGIHPMCDELKYIDTNIVADEAMVLFKEIPDWISNYTPLGVTIHCYSPEEAREKFIAKHEELLIAIKYQMVYD